MPAQTRYLLSPATKQISTLHSTLTLIPAQPSLEQTSSTQLASIMLVTKEREKEREKCAFYYEK